MLGMNARKYYRETLETELGKIGIAGKRLAEITDKVIGRLCVLQDDSHAIRAIRLPDNFFDIARATRIIARQETTTPDKIIANLEKHVDDLFLIHALTPNRSASQTMRKPDDQRLKPLPTDGVIIAAYNQHKQDHGTAPARSSRDGLPEGSPTWGTIAMKIRERSGQSLRSMAAAADQPVRKNTHTAAPTDKRKGNQKKRPSDEEIARIASSIKRATGRLPSMSSGHDGLPDGSVAWSTILIDLPNRRMTLGKLIKQHQDKLPAEPEKEIVLPVAQKPEPEKEMEAAPVATLPDTVILPEDTQIFSVQAERVFVDCARLIKKNRGLPTVPRFYDLVGGKSVPALNNDFKQGAVGGWERFTNDKPACLQDFLLSIGMAETKNGQVRAAPAHRIREIERTYGL